MDWIQEIQRKKYLFFAFLILLGYLSPFLFLQGSLPILVHDGADSTFVWFKILADSGQVFGSMDALIPQIMNGLPRNLMGSEFSVITWLYILFEPYTAFAINIAIMHIVAFFGMYLLLKKFFLVDGKYDFIAAGVSLAFSLLPFWPNRGLGIAGMPLLLYAFLNIRNKQSNYFDWIILCALPFYTLFTHTTVFFLTVMGMLWIYDILSKKEINTKLFIAVILSLVLCLIVEYRLMFQTFFLKGFVSIRSEHNLSIFNTDLLTVSGSLDRAISNFSFGYYHEVSFQAIGIGLAILFTLIWMLHCRMDGKTNKILYFPFIIIGITCGTSLLSLHYYTYLEVLNHWRFLWYFIIFLFIVLMFLITISFLQDIKKPIIVFDGDSGLFIKILAACFILSFFWGFYMMLPIINVNGFDFSRFNSLHPLLWYLLFAMSLKILFDNSKYGCALVGIILVIQLGYVSMGIGGEYQLGGIRAFQSDHITFNEYYSPLLFNDIKNHIAKPQNSYRIISIGLHPAITQYNGFYTLDMYHPNYPLEYKKEFREIIANELDKNLWIKNYFDFAGSRCYVFTNETGKTDLIYKDDPLMIEHLELNTTTLKEMGGSYIISAVEIKNFQANNLTYIKTFERTESPWKISLYEVNG